MNESSFDNSKWFVESSDVLDASDTEISCFKHPHITEICLFNMDKKKATQRTKDIFTMPALHKKLCVLSEPWLTSETLLSW